MNETRLYELHASICQILANPKRLEIIDRLQGSEQSVSQLAEAMQIGQANLSQHLGVMRQRGIVTARRDGLNVYYRLASPKIVRACMLMREVLLESLEGDAEVLRPAKTKKATP
ncbi:MAG: winged helix-turn-helix transcriptional regulator [Chloroflexi bacterium]|nr:winged helix-turn-helix transcriptional regulator [Chloroflexota bacterium]